MLNTTTWLPPRNLATAEAQLARWENMLLLAQRGDDGDAIEKAICRRDVAAAICAKIRHNR